MNAHLWRGNTDMLTSLLVSLAISTAFAQSPEPVKTQSPTSHSHKKDSQSQQVKEPTKPPETPISQGHIVVPGKIDPVGQVPKDKGKKADDERHDDIKFWVDIVLAGATVGLFVFTALLFWATRGLLNEARRQFPEFRKNVQATIDAANASLMQAKIAVNMERPRIYPSSIEYLRVEIPTGPVDAPTMIHEGHKRVVSFTNYGPSPAFIISVGIGGIISKDPPAKPIYDNFFDCFAVVERQKPFKFTEPHIYINISNDERQSIENGQSYIWLWIYIRYGDVFGGVTESGFVFRGFFFIYSADPREVIFASSDIPEYTFHKYYAEGTAPPSPRKT